MNLAMNRAFGRMSAVIFLMAAVIFQPHVSWSQEDVDPFDKSFTLYWENDGFTDSDDDGDYTNGVKLALSRIYTPAKDKRSSIKRWMFEHLPLMGDPEARRATTFSIGQSIYTPDDTESTILVTDDRPYAGYVYAGFAFSSNSGTRRDVWEFEIGVVGPWSLAEESQELAHEAYNGESPEGWDNQLDNELGLGVAFESRWRSGRLGNRHGFSADLIPHAGARLGNIATYANVGAEIRFGWLVPEDFGTCPIRTGCVTDSSLAAVDSFSRGGRPQLGIYLFITLDGRAVLQNIFLDGNTFEDSHSVDKKTLVGDLKGGVAINYGRFRLTYAYVLRTEEFEERDDEHQFGTISLSYLY